MAKSGTGNGTTLQNPLSYIFTPSTPGTYVFKPFAKTQSSEPYWSTSGTLCITVSAAPPPTYSITAGQTSLTIGQSTTITERATPVSGDPITSTSRRPSAFTPTAGSLGTFP